jgi:long-chain acyl-CoA synthetase
MALTDFNGQSFQYRDVARKIAKLHVLYQHTGIKPGDKIALCGRNSSQWSIAFLSIVTYGAVAVPILHEFKADNIHHLVNHSEARIMYVDQSIWENLDPAKMPHLEGALQISDYTSLLARNERVADARAHLNEYYGRKYPDRFVAEDVKYHEDSFDELALINYTSGSTGNSKGVMLTYGNLWSNVRFALDNLPYLLPGDGMVCMLPLAHMYGLAIELLFPFSKGCHINFLTRVPSPRVIMEAFATVKPKLIISVPLILEKIIKTKVFPLLEKPLMKLLMYGSLLDWFNLSKVKLKHYLLSQ